MPCRDGTGPRGMKDRADGDSEETDESCECQGQRPGHGMERGLIKGLSRRSACCCEAGKDLSPAEEMDNLVSTARQLEEDLKDARERIEKLRSSQ